MIRLLAISLLVITAASQAFARPAWNDRQCAKLERQIERVHEQMRAGYSAKKGIRLAERLRELRHQRAKNCR